MSALC